MSSNLSIYDIALLAVKKAIQSGANEAEAFVSKNRNISVEINNNRVTGSYTVEEVGIGLRVVVGKKTGFASSNKLDIASIDKVVDTALSIAKASKEDPYWPGFPIASKYDVPEGIYSPDLARVSEDTIIENAVDLLDEFLVDKRIVVVNASISVSKASVAVANSNGLTNIEHSTYAVIDSEVLAREDGDVTPIVFDVAVSRVSFPNIDLFTERLRDYAISSLKPVKIESGKMPVVFHQIALNELLEYTLFDAISGDSVVRKRSFLANKEGQQVFSEKITIIDDGLLKQGWYTGIFDGEGVPMQKTVVIEKGVVKNFLFDHYWASRYGAESTGNASRLDYRSFVRISPTNLILAPGDMSSQEILSETRKGLFVLHVQGAHSSNPETGDFSVVATPAWYIDNGVLKPVRGVMLSGNIYEMLKNVEYIGKELDQKGHLVAPYIRLENVNVIAK